MSDNKEENSQDIDVEVTGEDNVDEPELESVEEHHTSKLKQLRDKLKGCEQEKMEHLEHLQRAKAEFLNAKKRLEEEKTEAKERAVDKLIDQLLPMYDSFTMAMGNDEVWGSVDESWRNGVEAIYAQLKSILQSYHVTEVNPQGEPFDPKQHEAMGYEAVGEEKAHDTVVQVLQVGFVRTVGEDTRAIRPARVMVGNFTETNQE